MEKWLVATGTIGLAVVFSALFFITRTTRPVKPALSGREIKPRVLLRFVNGYAALTVSRALILSMSLALAVTACTAVLNPSEVRAAEQSQVGNGSAAAGETGESLAELKEKLAKATNFNEMNEVFDSFKNLPGPNAEAAQILLDYLKDSPRADAWHISDALVKLMTDGQVAELAKRNAYEENNYYRYLAPVLLERINNAPTLTDAVLSLQKSPYSGYDYRFVELAWQKVFTDPGDATRWLDDVYSRLTDPAAKENLVSAVTSVAGRLTGDRRAAAAVWLWKAQEKEQDTATRIRQLLDLYRLGETKAPGAMIDLYKSLASTRDKTTIIDGIGNAARWQLKGAARDDAVKWLWEASETDAAPYCRQECLTMLYELGEKEAMERLVQETDKNGLAVLPGEAGSPYSYGVNWQLLKEISDEYPQCYLARGIRAYEEVRGEPYFEVIRREKSHNWQVYSYGDEQYDPKREIPGWEKFLAEFSSHPASDDAAYRLARSYEIEGRYADALNTMHKALSLPDGDIRYDAACRLVYILDVRMTYEDLKELSPEKLEPSLKPLIDYTLAVKEIRRDDFPQAAAMLEKFIQTYKGDKSPDSQNLSPLGLISFVTIYDFGGAVTKQLTQVKELAGLQKQWEQSKDPAGLYDLAAPIFHNQMLYYNHLWAGGRQGYNFIGSINATGDGRAPAEMATFAREMINYNHSLRYFRQVYSDPKTPPELKAKALYSTGLCYVGLDDWGSDAGFAFTPSEVRKSVIDCFQQFVREYPDISMADDALLALGAYTRDAAYLQKIIDEYPDGDMVDRAKRLITEMSSSYYRYTLYGDSVPYKVLSGGATAGFANVPQEIANWAEANLGQPFTGAKTSGEWSYILISAGEKPTAGYKVEIFSITDDGRGKLTVYYRVAGPQPGQMAAQVITCPHVLARIPASSAAVEFVDVEREGQPGGSNQGTSDITGKSGNESNGSAQGASGISSLPETPDAKSAVLTPTIKLTAAIMSKPIVASSTQVKIHSNE